MPASQRWWTAGATMLAALVAAAPAHAQPAALAGTVRSDSAATAVVDAAVILPALGRQARTDATGAFRLDGLPAGRIEIVVRAIGFAPVRDTITLAAGAVGERAIVLRRRVPELTTVNVIGDSTRPISPGLRAFHERRRAGFGRFVDEAELRRQEGRTIGDVIADRVPGVRIMRSASGQYAVSTRSVSGPDGRAIPRSPSQMGRCFSDVYLDGVLVYSGSTGGAIFDLARYGARDFAGVEYYAGGASIPVQFNRTSTGCGTLLLWTRER